MALGFLFTFLLPETRGRTLEEISSDKIPEPIEMQ
jgi:hypothetical protein